MNLLPMAFIPFMLFTNFLVSLDQIPVWIRWIEWLDPFKYLVDALSITEFKDQLHHYECVDHQGQQDCYYLYDGNGYLEQIDAGYSDTYLLRDFVDTYQKSVYIDWLLLFILLMGFSWITWFVLMRRNGF